MRSTNSYILMSGMFITLSFMTSCQATDTNFYVYHTRLDKQKKGVIESNLREDARQYQDIVVNIGEKGKFIFVYDSNYRPYWKTEKGQYSVKDIIYRQPDTENNYSYARVMEKSPEKIVVHWRYYPKLTHISYASPVHEYFEIHPDGKIKRKVVEARERLDEYLDKGNIAVQMLQLEDAGIKELSYTPTRLLNEPGQPVEGSAVISKSQAEPALWLSFDEGMKTRGDKYAVKDKIKGKIGSINGGMALWKKGVSGTCLAFNGYNTSVSIPADQAPRLEEAFSVEAWVAMGAYPWNNAPLIQQKSTVSDQDESEEDEESEGSEESGYCLGVNSDGRPFFVVNEVRIEHGVIGELGLHQWHHLAGTVGNGVVKLYLDGKIVASSRISLDRSMELPEVDLVVGLNTKKYRMRQSEWHRGDAQNLPAIFGIEGLIDEVRVYTRKLTDTEIKSSYKKIPSGVRKKVDLQPRILPGEVDGKPAERFGAYYTSLKYHDLWDNLWRLSYAPDVVVRFDLHPVAVTYWHGQNYAAGWVTENNRWMADQSCEEWGEHGCAEHMSDKQCRFCYVRIIENTPARSIVHWRYRSVDVGYKPGEMESYCWTDEYHTLYPDGAAVRRVSWNLNSNPNPGWQDIQIFLQPGTDGDDHLHKHAMTMANLDGETELIDFTDGAEHQTIDDALIETVNFKSEYKVFMIAPEGTELRPWSNPFTGRWDHWPVGQYPSDGREAVALDRVAHTALSSGNNIVKKGNMAVYGLTNKPITSLVPLAKMWNHPPTISNAIGCKSDGFYQPQRSFNIIAKDESMSFTINGSQTNPVFNPCLVIKNWNTNEEPEIHINGEEVRPGSDCRIGIERGTNGKQNLVIWINMHETSDVSFKIIGAKPDTVKPAPAKARWVKAPGLKAGDRLAVVMAAAKAHDASGLKYHFECINDSAASSKWLDAPEYEISGLIPNKTYRFKVRTKDEYNNYSDWSSIKTVITGKARPAQASWNFDNGSGKKVLDEYGKYHARVKGASRQAGYSGKGLRFGGRDIILVDDYESFSTARDFSWTAWIKTIRGGAIIAHTAEEERDDGSICMYVDEEGYLGFSCFFSDFFSDKTVNDGQWNHVVLTGDVDEQGYDELTFYINGEPSGQVRINVDKFPGNGLLVKIGYGNREFPENGGFRGLMDEVKWYDYVLGPGHVKKIYRQHPGIVEILDEETEKYDEQKDVSAFAERNEDTDDEDFHTEVLVERNVMVPMRDGVKLATDVYVPDSKGSFPVILMRTPYGRGEEEGRRGDGYRLMERGYACVIQSCRGRRNSEGDWEPFVNERADGLDTHAWILKQPWCNGKIGTTGGSYSGITAWAVAADSGPSHKVILANNPLMDGYHDLANIGGAFGLGTLMTWGSMMARPTKGEIEDYDADIVDHWDWDKVFRRLPLSEWDRNLGFEVPYMRNWIKHETFDAYWEPADISKRVLDVDVPGITMTGWYDIFVSQAFRNVSALRQHGRHENGRMQYLICGPWSHGGEHARDYGDDSDFDDSSLVRDWLDYWLKGEEMDLESIPAYQLFVMGRNKWRTADEWPLKETQFTPWYLHSGGSANTLNGDGTLSMTKPNEQPTDTFMYDPDDPVPTIGGNHLIESPKGAHDQRPTEHRQDVLVYTSAPVEKELEVTGPVRVVLYAASSALDTDWTAKLVDVAPDGTAYNLCDGVQRARWREVGGKPSLIEPGKVYRYEIDLWVTSNAFLPGHRLRVDISSSNFPRFDRNPNTGHPFGQDAELITAEQTVYHNKMYPSHIVLPVIPAGSWLASIQIHQSGGSDTTLPTPNPSTGDSDSSYTNTWQSQVNNTGASIAYVNFGPNVPADGALNNDAQWGVEVGATATFSYTGNGVRIFVWRYGSGSQTASVTIDGISAGTINVNSGAEGQVLSFEHTSLSSGPHTVVVTVTGGEVHFDAYQVRN